MKKKAEFKGTKEGIVLQLDPECEFEVLLESLQEKIDQGKRFFSGATVVGVEGRTLNRREKEVVQGLFSASDIQVAQLDFVERLGHNSSSEKAKTLPEGKSLKDKEAQLPSDTALDHPGKPKDNSVEIHPDEAKIVFGTLRSGRRIDFPGHVIVVGDVNPGAEIVARGHIVIMGTLRGVAHAGSAGDVSATITAFRLNPTQLRIGIMITRPPEGVQAPEVPEIARIRDGNIIIEPYL